MDQDTDFYQKTVDRTNYKGCWWVAIISGCIFIVASVLLWQAATYVKQHHTFHLPFSTESTSSLPTSSDDLQAAANQQLQQQEDNAKQQAKDAAAKEAQKQADAAKQNLQNYLSQ